MSRAIVTADWDPEAKVWVAVSNDIIGLVLQGKTMDAIHRRVRMVAPSLMEANKQPRPNGIAIVFNSTLCLPDRGVNTR